MMALPECCSTTGRVRNSKHQRFICGKYNGWFTTSYLAVTKIAGMAPGYCLHYGSLYDNRVSKLKNLPIS
jgi:hypothetical protein